MRRALESVKPSLQWLVLSSASFFVVAAVVSVDLVAVLILIGWLIVLAIAALAILCSAIWRAWSDRDQPGVNVIPIVAPLLAGAAFACLVWPLSWGAHKTHVYGILLANWPSYEKAVAQNQLRSSVDHNGVLVWTYGGWLDDDEDIVWDSLDRPERDVEQKMSGGSVSCHRLMYHYYDCGIWF